MYSCGPIPESDFNIDSAHKLAQEGWEMVPDILKRIEPPKFKADTFLVTDFGASGDGVTPNKRAFDSVIAKCANTGGGVVVVPTGNYYFDGPIYLKSNVNIHLKEGAGLYFSNDPDHYLPLVKVRWEGTVCYNYSPLIYSYQEKNIAITGTGTIDGNGLEWSEEWRKRQKTDQNRLRQMGNDLVPDNQRVFGNGFLDLDGNGKDDGFGDSQQHYLRPGLVQFYECQNILVEGVTLRNSPFWTLQPVFSSNIIFRDLRIYGEILNDDGIDPDSCEDVLIQGCIINTHDDAIAIKAGRDQDAWDRPGSKNIIIRNNELQSGVNALTIGSEMSGGVSFVFMEGNKIAGGKNALNFKTNMDRGGSVNNIYIKDIEVASCDETLFKFRMDYHGYRGNLYPTKFNNFFVSDISCRLVQGVAIKIIGVEEQFVSKIFFKNIKVQKAEKPLELEHVDAVLFEEVYVNGELLEIE